jgi:hypothetical protein
MTTTYCTNAQVLAALKGFGTNLTAAEIDDMINQCEGILQVRLRIPSTFTFAAAKIPHLALRDTCIAMVCLRILAATPQSCNTLDEVTTSMDVHAYNYEQAMNILDTELTMSGVDFMMES